MATKKQLNEGRRAGDQMNADSVETSQALKTGGSAPEGDKLENSISSAIFSFDEFVGYGKCVQPHLVNGMPRSWSFYGFPVTHENDDLYIVNGSHFKRGCVVEAVTVVANGEKNVTLTIVLPEQVGFENCLQDLGSIETAQALQADAVRQYVDAMSDYDLAALLVDRLKAKDSLSSPELIALRYLKGAAQELASL